MTAVELEGSNPDFKPVVDRRPLIPEPLPVKLVAVDDVRLPTTAGLEKALDRFYVHLLKFERDTESQQLAYRAENFRLKFDLVEGLIERDHLRAQEIEIQSLVEMEHLLVEEKIDYERQRGVSAGRDGLLLRDPAGNWIFLVEMKTIA